MPKPYKVAKRGTKYVVVDANGKKLSTSGTHDRKSDAVDQLRAVSANTGKSGHKKK